VSSINHEVSCYVKDKKKVKLSQCFNWAPHHGGVLGECRCSSTHPLTSALDGDEWSTSRPSLFTPGKEPLVPIGEEAGWAPEPFWTRLWREKFPAPAGNRTLEQRSPTCSPAYNIINYPLASFVLGRNIFMRNLVSIVFNLCSSLKVSDHTRNHMRLRNLLCVCGFLLEYSRLEFWKVDGMTRLLRWILATSPWTYSLNIVTGNNYTVVHWFATLQFSLRDFYTSVHCTRNT
jgi:hypothetical protein